MPDNKGQPLPPLPDEVLDGYKEEATIHKNKPLEHKCVHKNVRILNGSTLECGCGAGWNGPDILALYNALIAQ